MIDFPIGVLYVNKDNGFSVVRVIIDERGHKQYIVNIWSPTQEKYNVRRDEYELRKLVEQHELKCDNG